MSNKKVGNDFESELCQMLFAKGWWVHNLAQNKSGQPADIIAVKNGNAYLIDAKTCKTPNFKLGRMEENQRLAMETWKESGNGNGWFAIRMNTGNIYFADYDYLKVCEQKKILVDETVLHNYGYPFDEWEAIYGEL